jgi:NAD(P)-dependent dehydrogenase (short-subunit alcohol dehydrogenase family)
VTREPSSAAELFSLRERAVIVTGASSGLGDRFARVLVANGAKVLAVARRAERLEALADEVPNVVPFAADLADETARAAVVAAALDAFGAIDVLVNNAGSTTSVPAVDEPVDDFRAAVELHLVAAFDLAQRCARTMRDQGGGSIVNVASAYGLVAGTPLGSASYSASKGALVNLTRQLGCEWATDGVRVNALAPGWFLTEMTAAIEPESPPHRFIIRNTPMRRFGLEHELDGILLYLASDASTYCTGQVFAIDGGWTAR